ncbi:hypothetical protein F53441_11543 [Fusarium austroafricanum]|uniref:Fungal N-terminal domain-containing protein n=1 Tax=Fusarium austroafricanum TaxID=2364996 RepID=A0A8H4NLX3_9HYPO|nr:hypothetical protein F53441_11543 [Fusarium austroafricanum]
MDPLSIIASIAGIASAGAQLSNTLFHLFKTVRNASRDIQSVAIEMSGLTVTLEHLADILKTGHSYTKPAFFEGVRNVIKNIQATQRGITKMVTDNTVLARLKWLRAARLLSDIDKHKVTLTLQITILSAAVLVKSTNSHLSVREKVDNRFRVQAESLIQAGQASLQNDDRTTPIPDPPTERAPSPPVRTTKRLPSPARRSEIPGHGRTDELYGHTEEDYLSIPGTREEASSVVARSPKAPPSPNGQNFTIFEEKGEEVDMYSEDEDDEIRDSRRGRSSGFDPLSSGRIAQFGRDFHKRGDAATFLYKLVFLNEYLAYGTSAERENADDDIRIQYRHRHSDESDEFGPRVRERERSTYPSRETQEPEKVVNRLLLEWTSLSESEIENGSADTRPKTTETRGRYTYVESEDEDLYSTDDEDKGWDTSSQWANGSGADTPPTEEIRYNNVPQFDPRGRRILRPIRSQTPNSSGYNQGPRHTGPSPTTAEPTMPYTYSTYYQPYGPTPSPYAPYSNSYTNNSNWMPQPGQPNPYLPIYSTTPRPPPPEEATAPSTSDSKLSSSTPESKPARAKFQKPHVVVLPQADSADSEIGATTPNLDVTSCQNMSIARQGDVPVWNCDAFTSQNNIPGKAIMGALIGDKSARNPHGLDLAHTLIQGQNMKLVYIRGNDLGETWFINEQPVFLQFLHCAYAPQFYPTKEADDRAMKEEYVAIGEEWASFEALNQLGLSIKSREEGRVLLDPSTTWSMIKELATTTMQLRTTFRQKHLGIEPQPLVVTIDAETLPSPAPAKQATVEDENETGVFTFQVKEEVKEDSENIMKTESKAEPNNLKPQITITPPTTPQETSSAEFDSSEVASHGQNIILTDQINKDNQKWERSCSAGTALPKKLYPVKATYTSVVSKQTFFGDPHQSRTTTHSNGLLSGRPPAYVDANRPKKWVVHFEFSDAESLRKTQTEDEDIGWFFVLTIFSNDIVGAMQGLYVSQENVQLRENYCRPYSYKGDQTVYRDRSYTLVSSKWTGELVVKSAVPGVVANFRIEDLSSDNVWTVKAEDTSKEGSVVYRFSTIFPETNANYILDDTPLEGLWPWPRQNQKVEEKNGDNEESVKEHSDGVFLSSSCKTFTMARYVIPPVIHTSSTIPSASHILDYHNALSLPRQGGKNHPGADRQRGGEDTTEVTSEADKADEAEDVQTGQELNCDRQKRGLIIAGDINVGDPFKNGKESLFQVENAAGEICYVKAPALRDVHRRLEQEGCVASDYVNEGIYDDSLKIALVMPCQDIDSTHRQQNLTVGDDRVAEMGPARLPKLKDAINAQPKTSILLFEHDPCNSDSIEMANSTHQDILSKAPDPQNDCPLFSVLPGEVRDSIFSYVLTDHPDPTPTKQFNENTCYTRPSYLASASTDTRLLRTCRAIYRETWFKPFLLREQTEWATAEDRAPPSGKAPPPLRRMLRQIATSQGTDEVEIERLRVFAQMYKLEDGSLAGILRTPHLAPRTITLTIRHTDWWFWEDDEPLRMEGDWIAGVVHAMSPKTTQFIIELESLERKKDQVDKIAKQMVDKWFFKRPDDGVVLFADTSDAGRKVSRWSGSSTWHNQPWIRDETEPNRLDYYVVSVPFRHRIEIERSGGTISETALKEAYGDSPHVCPKLHLPGQKKIESDDTFEYVSGSDDGDQEYGLLMEDSDNDEWYAAMAEAYRDGPNSMPRF